MRQTTRTRAAVLAASVALAAPLALTGTGTTTAAAADCEFPTYQYVVTGDSVTVWSQPEGRVKAVMGRGYLVNSGVAPDAGGSWLVGHTYTPSRTPFESGWVLRSWTSYTGTSWC